MDLERKGDVSKPKDPVAEAVYVAEAEKYDKALVESWKSNMEGMLIFAGLFSASLTAFIVESYKTLNPDATVQLLTQISMQLSASSNSSTLTPPTIPAFTPSTSALVCNALWFTSLGLSLSCALVATLLEQWARDFIHRSELKSAPLIRARVFSFLYYGLRRFSLHTVVDVIPLLLHAALLFFFAGLVAFLIPVSIPMAVISAAMLVTMAGVYFILTFHPLLYLDSPYRTPLSGLFWGLFRRIEKGWRRHHGRIAPTAEAGIPDDETFTQEIIRTATDEFSETKASRDAQALTWTVRSLSDESELEPFVEAIPRTLWALGIQRDTYAAHFRELVFNPDVALYSRIRGLLDSCDTGLLSFEARRRRLTLCYQALWSVATLFASPGPNGQPLPFPDPSPLPTLYSPTGHAYDNEILKVSVSAGVLIEWIHFQTAKWELTNFLRKSVEWHEAIRSGHEPDLSPLTKLIADLALRDEYDFPYLGEIPSYRYPPPQKCAARMIPHLLETVDFILSSTPYNIWSAYIRRISVLNSLPAYFKQNLEFIQLPPTPPPTFRFILESLLSAIVPRQLEAFNSSEEPEWMDTLLQATELISLSLKQVIADVDHPPLPDSVIRYLCNRKSDRAVFDSVGIVHIDAVWGAFEQELRRPLRTSKSDILAAFWRIALSPKAYASGGTALVRRIQETASSHSPSITASVVALVQWHYLRAIHCGQCDADWTDPIFPGESAFGSLRSELDLSTRLGTNPHEPTGRAVREDVRLSTCIAGARYSLVASFLESCAGSADYPYEAVKTLKGLHLFQDGSLSIHPTHQIRLAHAIQAVFNSPRCSELRTAVIHSDLFAPALILSRVPGYSAVAYCPWLHDELARRTVGASLAAFSEDISTSADAAADFALVQAILDKLEPLNPLEPGIQPTPPPANEAETAD